MTDLDLKAVFKRLDAVEGELREIRELLRDTAAPAEPAGHPYVESVATILDGEPIIRGTRTPVRAVAEHWKFGDMPEEIARKLPYLRLAQIFDALAYYDDHRDEIEHYIAVNRVPVDE